MLSTFRKLVDDEYTLQREKGRTIKSWHDGAGLLKEEYDEFWDEVRKKTSKRDLANALHELVQIAALCERVAIDLTLVDEYEKSLEPKIPYPRYRTNRPVSTEP